MAEQSPNSCRMPSTFQQTASGLILTLFLVRYFYVAESASQGETLWIVALWLIALLIWLIASWKSNAPIISFGWLDLSVVLLSGGHILSGLVVIATHGEKRAAINLAWEWFGVLVVWYLLRCECRHFAFRRDMLIALIAVGTTVSGLGLYQHYIEFPRMAAQYGPLFDRLTQANPAEAVSIRQTLAKENIPTEEPGITLFKKRLLDSREPLGLFALANTFGGFLAVCFMLAFSLAASSTLLNGGRRDWKYLWGWILIVVLLSWCLLLTKSRTACIGTVAGLTVWSVGKGRCRLTPKHCLSLGAGVFILVCIGWGLSRMGGLDRQVITEAPKSLQYRFQYWSATWQMIKVHPWLGVGPGQFRSYYLIYRLPEASEEISDPHNLFFDVAANGGITAFSGLLLLCFGLFWFARESREKDEFSGNSQAQRIVRLTVLGLAAVAWCFLLTGYDDRLLVVLPVAAALFWGLSWMLGSSRDDPLSVQSAALSAAIVLLVHLFGAGGIGMPAVCLTLLALVAVANGREVACEVRSEANPLPRIALLSMISLTALVALFVTSLQPVSLAQIHLEKADRFFQEKGNYNAANAEYRLAAAADPVDAVPWRKQAGLAFYQAQADQFRSNELFLNAVHLMHEATVRDPANYHDDQTLGDWWLSRWRVTNDLNDAREAVLAMERAWLLCPTSATLMAELAFAREAAGETWSASEMAVKALKQDELNHQKQHIDRYLTDVIRRRLEELANVPLKR